MSAYLLSDNHISTIAIYINTLNSNISVQELANKLKHCNIASVNFRYGEKTKKLKCSIIEGNEIIYSKYEYIGLIDCWDYQAGEDWANLDYLILSAFLYSFFDHEEIEKASKKRTIWSI